MSFKPMLSPLFRPSVFDERSVPRFVDRLVLDEDVELHLEPT